MSDDDKTPNQRLRTLSTETLAGYKAGRVPLRALIDDLDIVWNGLPSSSWSDEFRGHWWTLEQIYAAALDRGELSSLSSDSLEAIDEATTAIEALVNSWPEAPRPS
jgi:hypothetical protein